MSKPSSEGFLLLEVAVSGIINKKYINFIGFQNGNY